MDIRGLLLLVFIFVAVLALYTASASARNLTRRRRSILIALRLGFLVLLLVLWYRPTISSTRTERIAPRVTVIVDDTESMQIEDVPAESGALVSRAEWIRESVFAPEGGLLNRLSAKGIQASAVSLSNGKVLPNTAAYRPSVPETQLDSTLRNIARAAQRPSAVILVTDGVDTRTENPVIPAPEGIPVHVIGLGEAEPSADLAIENVSVPELVFRNEPVRARIAATRSGGAEAGFVLRVRDGETEIASQEGVFEDEGRRAELEVEMVFEEEGERSLRFEIEGPAEERIQRNNLSVQTVTVLKEKTRIVSLAGAPSMEARFIHRALEEDVRLEVRPVILLADGQILDPARVEDKIHSRDDLWRVLADADLILVSEIDRSGMTAQDARTLYNLVTERSGILLWLGGRRSLGSLTRDSQLARIFPFDIPRDLRFEENVTRVRVTGAGARNPGIAVIKEIGEDRLPPLQRRLRIGEVNPGAQVLLEAVLADGTAEPLLVVQRYGLGRVAAFLGTGTWAWQMGFSGMAPGDPRRQMHTRFWQGFIHGLLQGPREGEIRVETNGTLFDLHERVTAWVHLDEQSAAWFTEPVIPLTMTRPDGSEVRVHLSQRPGDPTVFEGQFTLTLAGAHRLTVQIGELSGSRTITARVSNAEFRVLNQRQDLLTDLAARSGGTYATPPDWSGLFTAVNPEPVRTVRHTRRFIGEFPLTVAAVLGLILTEWVLRRRWSLP